MYQRREFMINRPVLESMVRYYEQNKEPRKIQWGYALLSDCFVLALIEPEYKKEFDYLIYFADGKPDAYRYCIHFEDEHAIYHRFTAKEYEKMMTTE